MCASLDGLAAGSAPVNVVVTIQKHLRLNDGHKAAGLADGCVAGQAVGAVLHSHWAGATGDGYYGPPLGETGSCLVVLSSPLGKAIEALAPALAV